MRQSGLDHVSAPAIRLLEAVQRVGGRRLRLELVWAAFLDAVPEALTAPDKRAHLAALLDELARAGALDLPRSGWDRAAEPALPRTVGLPAQADGPPSAERTFPWRPELSWAAELRLTAGQRRQLQDINAWLRDDRATAERHDGAAGAATVPARERSLEILGEEKALDALSRTRLFGPGRLSWDLLRCRPVYPPFAWRPVGDGDVLLVVENHDTFYSLHRWLTGLSPARRGGVGTVAYGAGNLFSQSVGFAADLGRPVKAIRYFGDLDVEGLRMPQRAAATARALGLPTVEPVRWCYELLLDIGTPNPAEPVPGELAGSVTRWLGPAIGTRAAALLSDGGRLAQEWVGADVLTTFAAWPE